MGNFLLPIGQVLLQNWGNFVLLQIGASVITNWGSLIITNQGKFYYKSGQLLQIRAIVITNWGITVAQIYIFILFVNALVLFEGAFCM